MANTSIQQNPPRPRSWLLLPLLLAGFILLLTLLIHTSLQGNKIGADFYIFWNAGRSFFVHHVSPYSDQVTAQTQLDILRRPARPDEDNLAFAYPFYSLFGIFPNLFLSYDWALSLLYAFNLVALLSLLYLIFPAPAKLLSISTLLFYPVAFGLVMGNFAIPVTIALLLFYGMFMLKGSRSIPLQIICGILLAWATLKPQFVWLLLVFALLYALKEKLYPFLYSFFGSAALFVLLSFALLPGWLAGWIRNMQAYASYQQVRPVLFDLLNAVLPESIAGPATIALLAGLGIVSLFLLWRWWQSKESWLPVAAWLGMTTFLAHPHGMSYEQLPSLIPLMLWVARPGMRPGRAALVFWFAAIVFSWLPLFFRGIDPAIEKTPVLWIAVWIAWLFTQRSETDQQVSARFTV